VSIVDNARFVLGRVSGRASSCEHLAALPQPEPRPESRTVCPECERTGDSWKALRVCLSCGRVGCCDSSPNRHARRHAEASGHPVIRSLEPGESWMWCFADRRLVADDHASENPAR
jgi:uncharacterized UBP type Zn finger protein